MDDIIDGAEPSEPVATPEIEQAQAEPTPRDAIDRAFASLDAEDSGQKGTKPDSPQLSVDTEGQKRGPDGKFIANDAEAVTDATQTPKDAKPDAEKPVETEAKTPFSEPPSRFSAEAKEAWKTAPEPVKAEVHRALTEMEAGIEKHRAGAQEWENLREFSELAKANNVTVKDAMARYVAADRHLNEDLVGGLDALAKQYGSSLHDIAAHVLNQPADKVQSQSAAEIRALNEKIARLEHGLSGVTSNIQNQHLTATQREVEAFASAHPRFDELSEEIALQIKSGIKDLPTAYRRAELLNPLPAPAAPATPAPDLTAQTRKGNLSVSGAPSSGSNPANRKPPSSARDALDRAFASTGIG
tara:strand:+ start:1876 stop:2946 length:1071 start_codon:yes stop_codon:yes gene_type:complete